MKEGDPRDWEKKAQQPPQGNVPPKKAQPPQGNVPPRKALPPQGNVPPRKVEPPQGDVPPPEEDLPPLDREEPEDPQDVLRRRLRKVPMFAFIVFVGWVVAEAIFPGVHVVIENAGTEPLQNVSVTVHNQTKLVERIPPGQSATVSYRIQGSMVIYVEYRDEKDKPVRLESGPHAFNGARGTLRLRVTDGKLVRVAD
jgi:hypothetical protein